MEATLIVIAIILTGGSILYLIPIVLICWAFYTVCGWFGMHDHPKESVAPTIIIEQPLDRKDSAPQNHE